MNLDLFSSPGASPIQNIVNASRPWLDTVDDAVITYLPAAGVRQRYLEVLQRAFTDLAQTAVIDADSQSLSEIETILDKTTVLYIPGGNTYSLNHRLHTTGVAPVLAERLRGGLPYVGFSAGTVLCGATVLTSNDINAVATPHYDGLGLIPCSFSVHFDAKNMVKTQRVDDDVEQFHEFWEHPVVALEDDAWLQQRGDTLSLIRGTAWIYYRGRERKGLEQGVIRKSGDKNA